jgi:predicted regulator of Ras-like GTPase activity (Roadblock/LC7/MglB family)
MFKELLRELVSSVDGAVGAVIMGMDGISIEEYCEQVDLDLQLIGIEFSAVVKDMSRASLSMEAGQVGEIMMVTDKRNMIIRNINKDYFLTLVLNAAGNLGKGRFKLRMLIPKLAGEFE